MTIYESSKNEDPSLFCTFVGGPRDGLRTGDLPASLSETPLTGMTMRLPMGQPVQFCLYAVYECRSEVQIDGFWEFCFRDFEGPNGEDLESAEKVASATGSVEA